MSKYFLILFTVATFTMSCGKSSPSDDLVGTWRLSEVAVGDTTAFVPVPSDKIIELDATGLYSSNGLVCTLSESTDVGSQGQWAATEISLLFQFCIDPVLYRLSETKDELILSFDCLETCEHKYIRQ